MKAFIKESYARFKSQTPVYFKKIIVGSISVGGLGAGFKGLIAAGITLPQIIVHYHPYMIAVGAVGALVAKQACIKTPNEKDIPSDIPPDPPKQ